MTDTHDEFLYRWRARRIYAERRYIDELANVLRDLLSDAGEAGISPEQLRTAAGGDLETYLEAALANRGPSWK
jgi:hypothetical protein